jgi:hypothetical protein
MAAILCEFAVPAKAGIDVAAYTGLTVGPGFRRDDG